MSISKFKATCLARLQVVVRTAVPVRDATLTQTVALRANEFAPAHPDRADRLIAATALAFELTLVTADETLLEMPCLQTLG